MSGRHRVGIVGFGHLGRYLWETLNEDRDIEIVFVWNRSPDAFNGKAVPQEKILTDLAEFPKLRPDLIIEVAHPCISAQYGELFLQQCDYFVGSPTIFADAVMEKKLRQTAQEFHHALYVPSGAFWGGADIQKMADTGALKELCVTMTKHPSSFKLTGDMHEKNAEYLKQLEAESTIFKEPLVLYHGPVRDLCSLAPNNVNTMAAAALAAHNLGFDNVQGRLVADPKMLEWHVVEVQATGKGQGGRDLTVHTIRKNPATPGAVTGSATLGSFLGSVRNALRRPAGPGLHLC